MEIPLESSLISNDASKSTFTSSEHFTVILGGSEFSELHKEIEKRIKEEMDTDNSKFRSELQHLIEVENASRRRLTRVLLRVQLDKRREEGVGSVEQLSYSLWLSPMIIRCKHMHIDNPGLLRFFRYKFGKVKDFRLKAKFQYRDPETPKSISYSTEESGIVINEKRSVDVVLTFKECTLCPELKDKSDPGSSVLSLNLSFGLRTRIPVMSLQCSATNLKTLKMEFATDVVIVSGSGKEFKCHKVFLSGHSPVFKAMLLSGMEESRTGRVQVPDLDEEVVEAFLQYIYTRDTSEVAGDCELCFGLLYAAHKYQVKCLEEHAIELLQHLKEEDFLVDIALKLFVFLGNIPGSESEELKKRAALIMIKNFDALAALPEYDELDVKAVREINKYFANANIN